MTLERFGFIGMNKKCFWGMIGVDWVTPLKVEQIRPGGGETNNPAPTPAPPVVALTPITLNHVAIQSGDGADQIRMVNTGDVTFENGIYMVNGYYDIPNHIYKTPPIKTLIMSESNPTSFELKRELEEITEIISGLQKEKRNLKKVLKYTEEIEALQLLRVHKILFEKD